MPKRTRSDPIQFRLMLEDYAILEKLAAEAGCTPKEFVIDLTMDVINAARARVEPT